MIPSCHNRPPAAAGRWHATGRTVQHGTRAEPGSPVQWGRVKPVLRWFPRWFEDRCATHDGRGIGPAGENYPDAHGWDCAGCRWEPMERQLLREAAAAQRAAHGPESSRARRIEFVLR